MCGTAAAASLRSTVMRTISEPARASAATCRAVPSTSAVSVLVMDCTTTGAPPPTSTPPTSTPTDRRRSCGPACVDIGLSPLPLRCQTAAPPSTPPPASPGQVPGMSSIRPQKGHSPRPICRCNLRSAYAIFISRYREIYAPAAGRPRGDAAPMTDQAEGMTVTFSCPPELEPILPRPLPAVLGLPDWFKNLPQKAFSALLQEEQFTVKKCPPFVDAMTYGFLMPLIADLRVENGVFAWDREVPGGAFASYPRSPIDFHDSNQVAGTPLFDDDRFIIKFNNFWTIELPPGYSLLVTHPVNRDDLPFVTLTGLVDADRYIDNFIHFPARWRDPQFSGTLPKGTPVAQCLPLKRDSWTARFKSMNAEAT